MVMQPRTKCLCFRLFPNHLLLCCEFFGPSLMSRFFFFHFICFFSLVFFFFFCCFGFTFGLPLLDLSVLTHYLLFSIIIKKKLESHCHSNSLTGVFRKQNPSKPTASHPLVAPHEGVEDSRKFLIGSLTIQYKKRRAFASSTTQASPSLRFSPVIALQGRICQRWVLITASCRAWYLHVSTGCITLLITISYAYLQNLLCRHTPPNIGFVCKDQQTSP